jgi:hypothetical protein
MDGGRRGYLLAGATVAAMIGYLAWRPRMLRWGATHQEAAEALPGDDRTPHPRLRSTRAITITITITITIQAPPEQVWPWIVQMGMERAGFYSHDWVERLLGRLLAFDTRYVEGKHSATRIHPELQDLKVGDPLPYGGGVLAWVAEIEPCKHLVAGEAFVLRPLPGDHTRLLVRYQGMGFISAAAGAVAADAPLPSRLLHVAMVRVPGLELTARAIDFFIGDPLHHYMEVGMLRGIKQRAEAGWSEPQVRGRAWGSVAPPLIDSQAAAGREMAKRAGLTRTVDATGGAGDGQSRAEVCGQGGRGHGRRLRAGRGDVAGVRP